MFFRRKNRDQETAEADVTASASSDAVEGSAPDLVEAEANADDAGATCAIAATDDLSPLAANGDAIRLFPGFERDDFEVGFRADQQHPSLVMRWKDGGEWFALPDLFNRGVLAAMDERDSASDLNRLLRNYGYDVDAIAK